MDLDLGESHPHLLQVIDDEIESLKRVYSSVEVQTQFACFDLASTSRSHGRYILICIFTWETNASLLECETRSSWMATCRSRLPSMA
jgi:hypothetical protein